MPLFCLREPDFCGFECCLGTSPSTITELVAHDLFGGCLSPNPLDRGKTSPWNFAKSSPLSLPEPPSECSSARQEPGYCLLLALGRGRVLRISTRSLQNPIYTWKLSIARSSPHDTNNYGIPSRWQSPQLCLLHIRDIFPYSSFRGSRRDPRTRPITPSIKRPLPHHSKVALQASEAQCRGDRAILTVGCSPRFLPQQFGAVCGNDSSRPSMHLRSRNLPRPSASSPPGNRSHPMANPGQAPDLEGLHREIHDMAEQMRIMNENNGRLMQLLAAANPLLPAAPPVPDIERSRHSNRSGDRSQNISADRVGRGRRQALSSSLREKSSSKSSKTPTRSRRGRSPHRGDPYQA
ncbi:hypothetical protein Acr_15g0007120 [Actinidia rufa]|uniref:Uncharacterized protein n=1 Tax=Actinidia rufa TaxID=165716 RepID=A0A7J0FTT2_9ERIC|nr:hypothetical protein Acr_15g0007120 [Actinidia rufa]